MASSPIDDKKQAQRKAIMAVAKEHFERFGYKRTVIDDIVREVGIAKGTFYLYFKSKDQLLFELIGESRHEMMAEFQKEMAAQTTVKDQLRTMIEMSFQAFLDYPLLARIVADDPEFRIVMKMMEQPSTQEEFRQIMQYMQALLKAGIDRGELREDLDLDIVPIVLGLLKFLHYYTSLAELHGVSRKQFVDGLVDMALNGLLKR